MIKDSDWSIPLSKLSNIGLFNDIYNQTNEMEICHDMVDEVVFSYLYKILIDGCNIFHELDNVLLIKIMKLGDFLMCESLVNDICMKLCERMELMSEEELKQLYDNWLLVDET